MNTKMRQSSREKQLNSKIRLHENVNYYQPFRDIQNNSKLSNLLNLSQFNLNLNNNQSSDLNNKSSATQLSSNQCNKMNFVKKSPNIFNQRSSSSNTFHQGPAQAQNYFKNSNLDNQHLDMKLTKAQKTKRQKSSKKHVLSCNRILNIAKKRDTSSNIVFDTQKVNNIVGNYGSSKSKKKTKKQPVISKNQSVRTKNLQKKVQCLSLNQSKAVFGKQDSGNNFPVNYPLSMSHSYIVFSQKDTTLNNTANFLSKMSRKLQSSNENKLADLRQKLQLMKIERSAIVIQKHWRGYLTRKLLQDYILNEESKLINKLSNIKRSKEEFDRFQRMSPGCNKVWVQEEFDEDLKLSEILNKSYSKQEIKNAKDKDKQNFHFEDEDQKDQQNAQKKDSNLCEQGEQQTESVEEAEGQQIQEDIYKKQGAIHDPNQHENIIQSIINVDNSQSLTSRSTHRVLSYVYGNSNNIHSDIVTNSKLIEKSITTEITHRNKKNHRKLSKAQQFLISIKPSNQREQNEEFGKLVETQEQKRMLDQLSQFLQSFLKRTDKRLEKQRKTLTDKIKNTNITFDQLLVGRQKLKKVSSDLAAKKSLFLQQVRRIFIRIENNQENQYEKSPQQSISNINSPRNIKINRLLGKVTLEEQKILDSNEKSVESFKPSGHKNQNPHSPISQYFTIQLPTEELSPHKRKVNFGMESLKIYLENLQKDFLQQEQSTQTAFLCKVLKFNSQNGPQSMVQRCLIQMLVQILTNQLSLSDILMSIQLIINNQMTQIEYTNPQSLFIKKWADQLQKWELGPIQQVSCNMEQSADVTQRNNTSKKKKSVQFYPIQNQN